MQRYGKEAVKEIIKAYLREWAVIDDDGVRLSDACLEYAPTQTFHWKYACELEGPDAPDPLKAPCLPNRCTANELAAFMLDGIGAVLPTIYGDWANGPYQEMLDGMGILANKPREALKGAYQAYRDAEAVVGKMDATLEIQKNQLAEELEQKNEEANAHERVFDPNTSEDERRARRQRAEAAVTELKVLSDNANAAYQAAFKVWRKAMVKQLLCGPVAGPMEKHATTGWRVKTSIKRAPGYRWPLYQALRAAHTAGLPCPKARDVLEAWRSAPPPAVQVMSDGLKYDDGLGNPKEANLKAIQQAINGLLEK